jgi:transcription initiation factor TFIIIB Brf1 subunit/transcription initiation factor TFIIB
MNPLTNIVGQIADGMATFLLERPGTVALAAMYAIALDQDWPRTMMAVAAFTGLTWQLRL